MEQFTPKDLKKFTLNLERSLPDVVTSFGKMVGAPNTKKKKIEKRATAKSGRGN